LKRGEPSWLRYVAVNPQVPRSAVPGIHRRLKPIAMQVLNQADTDMIGCQYDRKPGEPTVRLGFGFYAFEEEVPPKRQSLSEDVPP
jgi:hypothetical protein